MKKLIKIITIFLIMTLFCEVSYGAEYLDSVDFVEKDFNYSVTWSGKEWITNTYPPKISQDGVEFTEAEGNEEVRSALRGRSTYDSRYAYFWTGNDYFVYDISPYFYNDNKYIYRISKDFQNVLDVYNVPNWITHMAIVNDKIFIATKDLKLNDNYSGTVAHDYEVYYSDDCNEWTNLNYDNFKSLYSIDMYEINNKLFIYNTPCPQWHSGKFLAAYLYSDDSSSEILYEDNVKRRIHKTGQYLCAENHTSDEGVVLSFSNDGVYWVHMIMNEIDENENHITKIWEMGDQIIVSYDSNKFYTCNKEDIYSQLREKLDSDPVYVKLNSNILGFETPPVIEDGRTLVPMRFLFEQMGATVEWNQETQTATATLNDTTITFGIDNIEATVNDASVILDVPARLINDKTMVPLRFLSEEMGYNVTWDDASRTAITE